MTGDNIIVITGMWLLEIRDAAKHASMPETALCNKKYPSPDVDNAETGTGQELLVWVDMKILFYQSAYWQLWENNGDPDHMG